MDFAFTPEQDTLRREVFEQDRRNVTRHWCEGNLACSFGGRVAEELVFGSEKITTGARPSAIGAPTIA